MKSLTALALSFCIIVPLMGRGCERDHAKPSGAKDAASKASNQPVLPSPEDQQQGWKLLSDFATDVRQDKVVSGGKRSWSSDCEVYDYCQTGGAGGADVSQMTAHRRAAQPGTAGASSLNAQPRGNPSPSYRGSTLFNSEAAPIARLCKDGCTGSVVFPVRSMIGRFDWVAVPKDKCDVQIVVFNPDKSDDVDNHHPSEKITLDTHATPTCGGVTHHTSEFLSIPGDKPGMSETALKQREGDVLDANQIAIILGFHLIGKSGTACPGNSPDEKCDWIWSTFWWSLKPSKGGTAGIPCTESCPEESFWKSYVMGVVSVSPPPTANFAQVSNPYIDQKLALKTNCVICHSYAFLPKASGAGYRNSMNCGAQAAASFTPHTLQKAVDKYFQSFAAGATKIQTDKIWSAANRPTSTPDAKSDPPLCPPSPGGTG